VDYKEFVAFCEATDTTEAVRVTMDGRAEKKAKKRAKKANAAAPVEGGGE